MPTDAAAEVELRPARTQDAAAMQALVREAYAVYRDRMDVTPAPVSADYQEIAGSGHAILAWRDDQLLGLIVAVDDDEATLIENVAVSPQAQGAGVGSRLMDHAEGAARSAGRRAVRLYTNEVMTENISFYLRRGYVVTGRAVEDAFRRVHFRKEL